MNGLIEGTTLGQICKRTKYGPVAAEGTNLGINAANNQIWSCCNVAKDQTWSCCGDQSPENIIIMVFPTLKKHTKTNYYKLTYFARKISEKYTLYLCCNVQPRPVSKTVNNMKR